MSKSKFIDVSELRPSIRGTETKYPYQEWVKSIPVGKALDITDKCDSIPPERVGFAIRTYMRIHQLPLTAWMRRGRLYVIREQDDA